MRHTANSSSQEPRGKENDGMTQPYSTDGGRWAASKRGSSPVNQRSQWSQTTQRSAAEGDRNAKGREGRRPEVRIGRERKRDNKSSQSRERGLQLDWVPLDDGIVVADLHRAQICFISLGCIVRGVPRQASKAQRFTGHRAKTAQAFRRSNLGCSASQ